MTLRICATASFGAGVDGRDRERVRAALDRLAEGAPELVGSHAALHLEGSLGAGDLTWDFAVADEAALGRLEARLARGGWMALFETAGAADREALATLESIEAWRIEPLAGAVPRPELAGIKRTNLVRVLDSAAPDAVARWSREVVVLAERVPAIRNWSLARVVGFGPTRPRVRWTHAWEQEFETLEGLLEDYMASAYHWGHLDGWYDPEMPHCIMDPDLAHLYGRATSNVLGWTRG